MELHTVTSATILMRSCWVRQVSVLLPHRQVSVLPPHRQVSVLPPHPQVSVLPPHRQVSVLPPHRQVSVLLPHPQVSVLPPHPQVSVLLPHRQVRVLLPHQQAWEVVLNDKTFNRVSTRQCLANSRPVKPKLSDHWVHLSSNLDSYLLQSECLKLDAVW